MKKSGRYGALGLAEQPWKVLFALAVIAGAIDLLNHLIVSALGAEVSFWLTFFRTIIWWVSYIPLLAAALLLANRYRLDSDRRHRNLLIHLFAAVGLAYAHTACNAAADSWWLTVDASFLPRLFRIVRINFPIDFVSYWAILGTTYALHYYAEWHQRELGSAQLEASLAEARLRALRSQLNPHFLFNTLNAVSALALKGEPKAVARMLSQLSRLLRISLDDDGPQETPLAKELDFLDSYLEIQRLWFGDRLTVHRNIAPDTLDALVPSMILQPLVENAFTHGIAKSRGEGRVGIEAVRDNGSLRLTVTDSGRGFTSISVPRRGIGLSNTQARLEQLYGHRYSLEYGQSRDGGASVTVRIPFVSNIADVASA